MCQTQTSSSAEQGRRNILRKVLLFTSQIFKIIIFKSVFSYGKASIAFCHNVSCIVTNISESSSIRIHPYRLQNFCTQPIFVRKPTVSMQSGNNWCTSNCTKKPSVLPSVSALSTVKNNRTMALGMNETSEVVNLARKFNCFYLTGYMSGHCKPFIIEGQQVGLVRPDVAQELRKYPDVFRIHTDAIELNPVYHDYNERSRHTEEVLREFRKNDTFVTLKGWREECYEVKANFDDPPLMKMERSATCLFGIRQYGVDINGYVNHPEKGLCIWFQRRASTKQTWPGKLDNMVGGGLSVGYSILETALKEGEEEASLTSHLLQNLKPCGSVSIFFESERGLFPNTEFVYDLELPHDFTPTNMDGEVDGFYLYTAQEALQTILSPEFKTTSCPVALDFLIRHGVITPENETNFPQLMELLHVPLQTLFSRLPHSPSQNGNGF